nr:T6SS effector amidase Tae4 family protein [uncultured Mucilaginibacter sp.]
MKKTIAYFLLVVFLFGSCKKENQLSHYVSTSSLDDGSEVVSKTGSANVKISTAALNTWFAKNPVGRYLTPDWTKAMQASVGGVAVVKIPIKAITNVSGPLNSGGKQVMSSGNTTTQGTLNNFDPNHPPTLYFFKNKLNPGDSLKAVLLNFVPADSNHENGENNIWTGKLLEWSLESDNVYYQDLDKSYVTSKGSITPISLSNNSKSIKINSLASFFNDIWNAIVWFFEWIGYNIGLPGTYTEYMNGTILTWCVFLGGVLCSGGGGGGDGGGGGGSGGSSYNFVYGSYLLGYNGYFDGSGWQPYATDSGGTPCPGLNATGGIQVMTLPGCPIIPPENTTAGQIISEAATKYGLNGPKRVWLNQHVDAFNLINAYVNLAGLSDAEKSEYFNWAIDYLKNNPNVLLDDFKNQFAMLSEGEDGPDFFDQSYWDGLQITQQTLPSYDDFYAAFPNIDANAVYNLIGGQILAHHISNPRNYSNACALRVSRALNYSGKLIPQLAGTEQGADGKNYFLSAKNLNNYLKKVFGQPTYHFTKADGGTNGENFPNLMAGKKGIYSMLASNWVASGHADLFTGSICDRGCDITKFTDSIDLWVLQ